MSIIVNGTELTDLNFNGIDVTEAYFNNVKIFEKGGAIGTLEETSWADIARVSALGTASNYWAEGDTKTFDLTDGTHMQVCIVGFNHDDKTDGTGKAGITFMLTHAYKRATRMHSSATTTVNIGWRNSEMRTTTLPAQFALLPNDLKESIKAVNKRTAQGYGQTTLVTTSDKLWLMSEKEMFNTASYGISGEGTHYSYFDSNDKRKRNLGFGSSTECDHWLRSPSQTDRTRYAVANNNGAIVNFQATATADNRQTPISFSFCFCI